MAAAEGDARFRLMFERSADAILLLDTSINKFVEYNQAALDMLRCTREELRLLHPSELSPPTQPDGRESFESANEHIATALREGSHRFEWMHRSPHRPDFPVEVLLTPIQGGAAPMVLVVWRDITERKANEEALRLAQKRDSLGVLAGGVAHDFNNLLAAIEGRLSLLRKSLGPGHAGHADLDQAEAAVLQAASLCRQMLTYSGQGTLQVEAVDLSRVAAETVEILRTTLRRGVRLQFHPAAGPSTVEANRAELLQVVMNLVTNAAEASQPGGTVTVRVLAEELDEQALATDYPAQALRPGPYVALTVEDQGAGMSPDVVTRVFDPFFSTKGAGRGLGLSALLGSVHSHRAGLHVKTAAGAGSTFTVVFRASAQSETRPAPPARSGQATGHGLVLVVDDHPALRSSTRRLLETYGFSTLEAADGPSAVSSYAQHAGEIRWVLMDLTMPGMDGHEAFLAIRQLDPAARVILSSGWAESELAARFRADPPLAFLPKPYREAELEAVLRTSGLLDD